MRHGAYAAIAREQLDAEQRRVLEALEADVPIRNADGSVPAADGVVIAMLAKALIQLERVEDYLARRGIEDDDGELRPAVELLGRLRREIREHADSLGMSASSRAKLGVDLARAAASAEEIESSRAARERLDQRAGEIDSTAEEVGRDA